MDSPGLDDRLTVAVSEFVNGVEDPPPVVLLKSFSNFPTV
jgi:hypothetical protein